MGCSCEATDRHFTPERAQKELNRYRRKGPAGTARILLRLLNQAGVRVDSVLDIGAGIGVLHHELLAAGVPSAVHVEASSAYIRAAQTEAERRDQRDRVRFEHGNFLDVAPRLAPADLVILDRVLCCYPDLDPLVDASAAKARRSFVHPVTRIHALLGAAGFEPLKSCKGWFWEVTLWARPDLVRSP